MKIPKGKKKNLEYCDRCDGVGWYEGGKTLQTKCEKCNGTGVILEYIKRKGKVNGRKI